MRLLPLGDYVSPSAGITEKNRRHVALWLLTTGITTTWSRKNALVPVRADWSAKIRTWLLAVVVACSARQAPDAGARLPAVVVAHSARQAPDARTWLPAVVVGAGREQRPWTATRVSRVTRRRLTWRIFGLRDAR